MCICLSCFRCFGRDFETSHPVTNLLAGASIFSGIAAALSSVGYVFANLSNNFYLRVSALFGYQVVELNAYIFSQIAPTIIKVSLVGVGVFGALALTALAIESYRNSGNAATVEV